MRSADKEPLEENDLAFREREARAKVGTTLRGKWRLDALIAIGGMGAVYDATHRNGMRGAVKVLDPLLGLSATARRRFLREGRLANQVHHPGAVRVLDDDEAEDGTTYLVMELLTGATLAELATRAGGKLEATEVIEYGLQVADTLAEAHACGIVHRDIKPENLFVTSEGLVKVLDFGIAGIVAPGSVFQTMSGELIGTPAFISPEQARGCWELVDGQSDVYSLGATLFNLLTGRVVHEASSIAEMLTLAITRNSPSLREAMPDAPDALVRAIDGSLKLLRSQRWANATAMRKALEEAYVAATGKSAPPSRPSLAPASKTSGSRRVLRAIRTTLAERRLPSTRSIASWGIAGVAVATLAVLVPLGVTTESAHTASALQCREDPRAPTPPRSPNDSSGTPSPTKVGRYDPLYDRRH